MDSPQMYDNNTHPAIAPADIGVKKLVNGNTNASNNNNSLTAINNNTKAANLLAKHHQYHPGDHPAELADLNTPEISLDLQNLIDDTQFNEGLFTDILNGANPKASGGHHAGPLGHGVRGGPAALLGAAYPRTTLAYMPQPVHSGANYNTNGNANTSSSSSSSSSISDAGSSASPGSIAIKEEPLDPTDFRTACHQQLPPGVAGGGGGSVAVPVPYSNSYSPPAGNSFASNGAGPTFTTLTTSAVPCALASPSQQPRPLALARARSSSPLGA